MLSLVDCSEDDEILPQGSPDPSDLGRDPSFASQLGEGGSESGDGSEPSGNGSGSARQLGEGTSDTRTPSDSKEKNIPDQSIKVTELQSA